MLELNISDELYPKKLLLLRKPPQKLFIEGNIELLNNPTLAIVGSRKITEYGKKYAALFSSKISSYGVSIISGLALGIDTVAHENSKNSSGKTIAVIGSGFNKIFPEENSVLAKQIIDFGGCIISEYPPDSKVDMKNFPRRNQIICGLSDGILVIEATKKSGSTLTGNLGLSYNKNVFCIPRNIGEIKGTGTNDLIKKGAKLVTSPQDILQEFNINYEFTLKQEQISLPNINIKPEYQEIFNLFSTTPISIEELCKKSKLSISEINQKLTLMEIEGYIKSLPGNKFERL